MTCVLNPTHGRDNFKNVCKWETYATFISYHDGTLYVDLSSISIKRLPSYLEIDKMIKKLLCPGWGTHLVRVSSW